MSAFQLEPEAKEEAVTKLKAYLQEELQIEIGSFDAGFLLDFFAQQVGFRYYNQGLMAAMAAMSSKLDEANELVYELELAPPE